jgi:hypothetical protein
MELTPVALGIDGADENSGKDSMGGTMIDVFGGGRVLHATVSR